MGTVSDGLPVGTESAQLAVDPLADSQMKDVISIPTSFIPLENILQHFFNCIILKAEVRSVSE